MAGPEILTFGCRLNTVESEEMRALAAGQDDLVIVNSCAVTGEAVRQARQAIRRARRDRPQARIVVTGCAAQTDPAMFAAMPEVDAVLGNREKRQAESFAPPAATPAARPNPAAPVPGAPAPNSAPGAAPGHATPAPTTPDPDAPPALAPHAARVRVSDIMAVRTVAPHLATAFADHARAFVEVQNGCDHRCTFCIIPYGRGNSRSVPAGAVVDRVRALVDEGYREVVLTGVDLTSYGPDLPGAPGLGGLVERILTHVPALPRLRLSSLDSVEIDDRLFALVTQEPRVMPHLHLSLQAGDDMVLKRMKRRHSRADAVRIVERLLAARPGISIGADIIAGFPTETAAMAENSLRLIADCHIVHGHIFPYSPRHGTPAARMPQVDRAVVRDRAARLRAACADNRARWLAALVGTRQAVLAEGDGLRGHAENFAPVRLARPVPRGEIVPVRIAGVENGALIAQETES